MGVKKQVIVLSVVFDEEETHAKSAADAISHRLFNEDGILEWDYAVKSEEEISADITDDDLEEDE
jgi:hypothetical protein